VSYSKAVSACSPCLFFIDSSFKSGMQSVMTGNSIATQIFQLKQVSPILVAKYTMLPRCACYL